VTARYLAFEGCEGSGKSTHAAALGAELDAVVTREFGGTPIGARIRSILLDVEHRELTPKAEALLIAADRAQHLAEVVEPALAAGRHVVSDRSVFSSLAYQGYARGLPLAEIRTINEWAIGGRWPDLVLFLDVPIPVLAHRMRNRRLDRIESEPAEFHERVRHGFTEMATADPARWVVVAGDRPPADVALAVRTAVRERLGL
jgi:dTMP kinase